MQYSTVTLSSNTTIDVPVSIGQILNTANGTWTLLLGGNGSLKLDATGMSANTFGNAGVAAISQTVANGSLIVKPDLSIANTNLDIGTKASGTLTINGNITATTAQALNLRTNGSGAVTVSGNIGASGSNITISNLGTNNAGTTLSGNLGASVVSVTQNGTSPLTLNGTNSAFSGPVNLVAGTLKLGSATALGTGALTIAAGASLDSSLTSLVVLSTTNAVAVNGNFIFAGTGSLDMSSSNFTLGAAVTNFQIAVNGSSKTLAIGALNQTTSGTSLTKLGPSSLTINGNSSYSGATTVSAGTLTLSGSAGKLATSGITVNSGTFSEDNSGTNYQSTSRFTNATVPDLKLQNGGKLSITGNTGAGNNTTETIGVLTLDTAQSTIVLNASTANSVLLNAGSLVRNNNATALVLGTGLGQGTTANNVALLRLTTAPSGGSGTLIGGSGNYISGTDKTIAIVPFLVGDSASGTGITFVGYDATNNSLRTLKTAELNTFNGTTANLGTAGATDNVKLSSANTAIGVTGSTVNSIIFDEATATAGVTYTLTGTLTPSSGAILFSKSGGTARTAILTGGSLAFASSDSTTSRQEGIITNTTTQAVTIATPISGSGGVTFSPGTGSITLSGTNLYTGVTTINGGTLQIGDGTAGNLAAGSGAITTTPQGTLSVALANNDTLANAIVNNGAISHTVGANTMTLSGNISGTGTLTQNLTGSNLVLSGNNTYTGATTITAGTLTLKSQNAAAGTILTPSGGTLVFDSSVGGNFNVGALGGSQAITLTDSGSSAVRRRQ